MNLIQYSAQFLLDKIDENTTTGATLVKVWVGVHNWSTSNRDALTKVTPGAIHRIRQFLSNPCEYKIDVKCRKTDHTSIKKSFYASSALISVVSVQPGGRGSWHIKLTKLKQQQVSPNSVHCTCHGSSSSCVLKRHVAGKNQIKKDQLVLNKLNSLLPMNMRPLQATNASNAADGGVECLGQQNSVDQAFLNAVASGDIIDVTSGDV